MSDPAEPNAGSGTPPRSPHDAGRPVGTASPGEAGPASSGSWPTLVPSSAGPSTPPVHEAAPSAAPVHSAPARACFEGGELAVVVSRFDIGVIESVKEFRRGSG